MFSPRLDGASQSKDALLAMSLLANVTFQLIRFFVNLCGAVAACLTFERPVAEFATLMEEDCAFEFVRCLALVKARLAAPTQCRARVPFDHEERLLDAPEFPKRLGQLAFLRRCR